MKLSIYKGYSKFPKDGDEKKEIAWEVSKPNAFLLQSLESVDDIIDVITKRHWSPFIFKEGTRGINNFISTDFMVLDIDDGMTIDEAIEVCSNMNILSIIAPSTSHTKELHRFRVVFPLSRAITNIEDYSATWNKISEVFPQIDPVCKDVARWYIKCRDDEIIVVDGEELLEPIRAPKKTLSEIQKDNNKNSNNVKVPESISERIEYLYGEKRNKIPESISYFLLNAHTGFPGEMFVAANRFLFACGLSGLDYDRTMETFYAIYPHPVTKRVEYYVDKAYQDGYNEREEDI